MGDSPQGFLRHLRPWIPVVLWAAAISYLSTDSFSPTNTSLIILPSLRWLFPFASADTLDFIHAFIRKAAHFVEYFVLSILLMRGVRGADRGWNLRWAIWAAAIAAVYSAFDEFHQSFVPSRHASPWDSLLDTTGAVVAQVVLWLWFYVRGRRTVPGDL